MDSKHQRQFEDELLEAALGARAQAEPRAGLEERILEGMEARRTRHRAAMPRWAWAFAAGAAAVTLVTIVMLRHPAVSGPRGAITASQPIAKPGSPAIGHPIVARIPPPAANSRTVRLAVFPAPRPLSPEEKMLLAYVRKGHLAETGQGTPPSLDEDVRIPKLEVAALDIKPIEGSQELPEK